MDYLKKYVEDIDKDGEKETDVVKDDFEKDMNAIDVDKEDEILRIDDNDGKNKKKKL